MPNRYVPDHVGFAALMVSPEMQTLAKTKAAEAVIFARAISPDRPPLGVGYVSSFRIEGDQVRNLTKRPTMRACADLVNQARYATSVELGWTTGIGRQHTHDGYHVLGQTAAFIGDPREPRHE